MTLRKFLVVVVALELLAAAGLAGLRLGSTKPNRPLVEQYNDALTGAELLALPDRYLFDSADKWRTLAETYAAFAYFSKADACFRRAAAADPRSPAIAFHHGYCLVRLGRLDEAQRAFERVIAGKDQRLASQAWHHLGEIHLRREQPDEALRAFERAGADRLSSVYRRTFLLVRSGRLDEAEPLLDLLADELPRDVRVWRLRAQVAADLGQRQNLFRARDALEWAETELPHDEMERHYKPIRERFALARETAQALDEGRAGDTAAAADRLTRLVRPGTRWDNVFLLLLQDAATLQMSAGKPARARELANRQVEEEQFPTTAAWQILGAADFSEENWQGAFEAWSRAERMNPTSVDHIKLATVVEHLGDVAGARRHRALAGLYAGMRHFRLGNLDEAGKVLRESLVIDDEVGDIWFYLGECERISGDPREAETDYRHCRQLQPAHGRALARLRQMGKSP